MLRVRKSEHIRCKLEIRTGSRRAKPLHNHCLLVSSKPNVFTNVSFQSSTAMDSKIPRCVRYTLRVLLGFCVFDLFGTYYFWLWKEECHQATNDNASYTFRGNIYVTYGFAVSMIIAFLFLIEALNLVLRLHRRSRSYSHLFKTILPSAMRKALGSYVLMAVLALMIAIPIHLKRESCLKQSGALSHY